MWRGAFTECISLWANGVGRPAHEAVSMFRSHTWRMAPGTRQWMMHWRRLMVHGRQSSIRRTHQAPRQVSVGLHRRGTGSPKRRASALPPAEGGKDHSQKVEGGVHGVDGLGLEGWGRGKPESESESPAGPQPTVRGKQTAHGMSMTTCGRRAGAAGTTGSIGCQYT